MSWLRLTATSNCISHPYKTYSIWLSKLICCPLVYSCSLTQLYTHTPRWLLLPHPHCCPCCFWHHPPCHVGIVSFIAPMSSPLLRWLCFLCCAGIVIFCGILYHYYVICGLVLASSPSSHWHCQLPWHHCPCCTSTVILVMLALLPLSHWRCLHL